MNTPNLIGATAHTLALSFSKALCYTLLLQFDLQKKCFLLLVELKLYSWGLPCSNNRFGTCSAVWFNFYEAEAKT